MKGHCHPNITSYSKQCGSFLCTIPGSMISFFPHGGPLSEIEFHLMNKQELNYWCKILMQISCIPGTFFYSWQPGRFNSSQTRERNEVSWMSDIYSHYSFRIAGNCHDLADSLIACYNTMSDCSILLLKG